MGLGLRLGLRRLRLLDRRSPSHGLRLRRLGLALGGLLSGLSAGLLLGGGGLLRGAGPGLRRLLAFRRLLGVPRPGSGFGRMLTLVGLLLLAPGRLLALGRQLLLSLRLPRSRCLLCGPRLSFRLLSLHLPPGRGLLGGPRLGFGLLGLHALTRLIASGPVAGPLILGPGRGARIGRGSGRRPAGLGLDRTLRLTGLTRRLSEGRASRSRRVLRHSSRRPRGLFGALTLGLHGRLSDGRGSVRLVPARPLRLDGSLLR